ncbi:MAG: PA2778 family cysteine peptidase [Bdellovibrionaceae bacterium]|nr:PA2778 family cysteine peptidase [Pseudobdellovibrionaceae bacterium]
MKFLFVAFVAFGLVGCASSPRQTDVFFSKPHSLPTTQVIESVPFIEQAAGHCGPASLAMALNWAGRQTTADEIAHLVYTPGLKGTFQQDMISAGRRLGMLAIPVNGVEALFHEVAAGHPVIVFQNLALSWYPQWHYAVVFGYDFPRKQVLMHSGPDSHSRVDMHEFESAWNLGDNWGLVLLPPGQLAAQADEFTHTKAAAALEQMGKTAEAELSYLRILEKWPTSLTANIGAANIAFTKQDFNRAAKHLKTATQAHPKSAPAWHNLAIVLSASHQLQAARHSAEQALLFVGDAERAQYKESLKTILEN